uniref:Secreted protein n=1 Tax=Anguilla anguilla TaxID=7936 RepID=A0A0E9WV69_ANGAN
MYITFSHYIMYLLASLSSACKCRLSILPVVYSLVQEHGNIYSPSDHVHNHATFNLAHLTCRFTFSIFHVSFSSLFIFL